MKEKTLRMILLVLLAVSLLCCVLILRGRALGAAEICVDGKLYRSVALDVPQRFTVESEWGSNEITVADGKISVTAASCPDHICMKRGCCASGLPIVCLPNRLSIRFVNSTDLDASVG